MPELLPFFIILFVALFFSELFNKLHLPWVIALIVGGLIIGPFGLDIFTPDATIKLLGDIGLIFLMFMAGLQTRLSTIKKMGRMVARNVFFNALIPFLVAIGIGLYFDLGYVASLLLGAIFISSSIAVVLPSMEANNLLATKLGKSIIATTVVEDILSLVFLSVLLQSIAPITSLPLPVFYTLLFGVLVSLRWALPKLRLWFFRLTQKGKSLFEWELQMVIVILIGTVVFFEFLGLHAIIGGFFAGLVLAESIKSDVLIGKLRAISYGFFIPVFFVVLGAEIDLGAFFTATTTLYLTGAIVLGSVISKFGSGWIAGRLNGFTNSQSILAGASTIPQLSTTVAVAVTGAELGILPKEIITSIIVLSVVTTFLGPLIVRMIRKRAMIDITPAN